MWYRQGTAKGLAKDVSKGMSESKPLGSGAPGPLDFSKKSDIQKRNFLIQDQSLNSTDRCAGAGEVLLPKVSVSNTFKACIKTSLKVSLKYSLNASLLLMSLRLFYFVMPQMRARTWSPTGARSVYFYI